MKRNGFSLIEMLIVMALIGIALSIAVPQFGIMYRRRAVEKQVRQIQTEISAFRLSAMSFKQRRAIILNPNNMQLKYYDNDTQDLYTGGTVISEIPLQYEIRMLTALATPLNDQPIAFDSLGNTNNGMTIVVLPVDISGGDGCIIVTRVRSNIGRMTNANTCTAL
jgi:prepilin-type N-terminal cleavage/methylation domain-containing protein